MYNLKSSRSLGFVVVFLGYRKIAGFLLRKINSIVWQNGQLETKMQKEQLQHFACLQFFKDTIYTVRYTLYISIRGLLKQYAFI